MTPSAWYLLPPHRLHGSNGNWTSKGQWWGCHWWHTREERLVSKKDPVPQCPVSSPALAVVSLVLCLCLDCHLQHYQPWHEILSQKVSLLLPLHCPFHWKWNFSSGDVCVIYWAPVGQWLSNQWIDRYVTVHHSKIDMSLPRSSLLQWISSAHLADVEVLVFLPFVSLEGITNQTTTFSIQTLIWPSSIQLCFTTKWFVLLHSV